MESTDNHCLNDTNSGDSTKSSQVLVPHQIQGSEASSEDVAIQGSTQEKTTVDIAKVSLKAKPISKNKLKRKQLNLETWLIPRSRKKQRVDRKHDCECKRCQVSTLTQTVYGILLGYHNCCVDQYTHITGYDLRKRKIAWENAGKWNNTEAAKWFQIQCGKLRCWGITEWCRLQFEKEGLSEMNPCNGCCRTVVNHLYKDPTDIRGALQKIINCRTRVFPLNEDPTQDQLDKIVRKMNCEELRRVALYRPHQLFTRIREEISRIKRKSQ